MALRMVTLVGLLALFPLVAAAAAPAQEIEAVPARDEAIEAARTGAKEWLALLDEWDWGQTWEESGKMLKAAVTPERWTRRMSVTLGPLGKVASRGVRSSEYTTTLPGAPDAEYVVLQYDTSFESGQIALENVVMKKEDDGVWRVSGYRIK